MLLLLKVLYVLLAIAMIALILMQRGAGAQAGSGFGGGASATVFGARGASNFLSKSTKWLAVALFAISLVMAWNAAHHAAAGSASVQDLGVMSQVPAAPAPSGNTAGPAAPAATTVPAAPAPASATPPAPAQQKQP